MSDFDDFEPYIAFNAVKKKSKRLFLFPPGNGGAESYVNNIASKLSNNDLVLFNNFYLYLENKFGMDKISHVTYEKLAEDYIHYIKIIQPEGPYHFFGWSFGGVLAFEVARQLTNKGHAVENIILVDSFFNYKTAFLQTYGNLQDAEESRLNCQYEPLDGISSIPASNILLFKAQKHRDHSVEEKDDRHKYMDKIYKYYVANTKANHLDQVLGHDRFNLKFMDHTHDSWIKDDAQITEICNDLECLSKGHFTQNI